MNFKDLLYKVAKLISPRIAELEAQLAAANEKIKATELRDAEMKAALGGAKESLAVILEEQKRDLALVKELNDKRTHWNILDLIRIESKVREAFVAKEIIKARSTARVITFGPKTEKLIETGDDASLRALVVFPTKFTAEYTDLITEVVGNYAATVNVDDWLTYEVMEFTEDPKWVNQANFDARTLSYLKYVDRNETDAPVGEEPK